MADSAKDPLADISDLVSATLDVLGPLEQEHAYDSISLRDDSPSRPAPSTPPPPAAAVPPLDPLSSLLSEPTDNIDLNSPVVSPAVPATSLKSGPSIQDAAAPALTEIAAVTAAPAPPAAALQQQQQHQQQQQQQRQHATPAAHSVHVRIKDPERCESITALGIKVNHWVYPVIVDSDVPGLVAEGMETKRRFSDFDALHKLLHAEYRGAFIPPLPQKTLIENSSEEFLKLRRADLQAFLRSVASHPLLVQSETLKVFLLQPGELSRNPAWLMLSAAHAPKRFGLAVSEDASAASTSGGAAGAAALAGLTTWVSWVKQSAAPLFTPPKRELPPGEDELRQIKELLQDLERLLQLATHSARTLCQDMEKLSTDFREFGFNMGMLSKYEEAVQTKLGQYTAEGHSASNRAADLTKFAACHAKQHTVWKTLSIKAASNLVVLHDYYILIPEAARALEEREAALEQVFAVQDELALKQQLYEASPAHAGQQERRMAQLSQQVATLKSHLVTAREQYEAIKARNRSELARIGLEREGDFKHMMSVFAANQAQLLQSSTELWAALAAQYAAPSGPSTIPP